MIYCGLLSGQQKCDGYFASQDEDFIYVFHGKNTDQPRLIGVWLYDTATVREIREATERDSVNVHNRQRERSLVGSQDTD